MLFHFVLALTELLEQVWTDDLEAEAEEEMNKPKRKSEKQRRHEADLKARGKWKEPYHSDSRLVQYPNSDIIYQQTFDRQHKPLSGINNDITVMSVESAREIYVQTDREARVAARIAKELDKVYEGKDVPPLPKRFIQVGNACVVKFEDTWYRCRIKQLAYGLGAQLFLVDYGRNGPIIMSEEFDRMKILLHGGRLHSGEQVYQVKLARVCEATQTSQEKDLLKELLPVGSQWKGEFDRKMKVPVYRVHIDFDGTPFYRVFERELEKRGIGSEFLQRQKELAASAKSSPKAPEPKPYQERKYFACFAIWFFMSILRLLATAGMFWEQIRKQERELLGDDRDETASLPELSEERKEFLETWMTGDEHVYPNEDMEKGLTLVSLEILI